MYEAELSKSSRWTLLKLMFRSWRTLHISRVEQRPPIVGNFIPTTITETPRTPPPSPRKK